MDFKNSHYFALGQTLKLTITNTLKQRIYNWGSQWEPRTIVYHENPLNLCAGF